MAIDQDLNYVKNKRLESLFYNQKVPGPNTLDEISNLNLKNTVDQELNFFIGNTTYVEDDPTTNVADPDQTMSVAARRLYNMSLKGEEIDFTKLPTRVRHLLKNRKKDPALGITDNEG